MRTAYAFPPQYLLLTLRGKVAVGPVGFEPTTYGLKVRSSTIELEARLRLDVEPSNDTSTRSAS